MAHYDMKLKRSSGGQENDTKAQYHATAQSFPCRNDKVSASSRLYCTSRVASKQHCPCSASRRILSKLTTPFPSLCRLRDLHKRRLGDLRTRINSSSQGSVLNTHLFLTLAVSRNRQACTVQPQPIQRQTFGYNRTNELMTLNVQVLACSNK